MNSSEVSQRFELRSLLQACAIVLTAAATVVIAYAYFSQIGVMKDQLETMQGTLHSLEETQKIALKPLLKMHLHKDPNMESGAGYEETDEGGERWQLQYYLLNIGKNVAADIRYSHSLSTDSVLQTPDKGELEIQWANDLLFPDEVVTCGFDLMLRQTWTDRTKDGIGTYRHFIVSYKDEYQNQYTYHAVWQINYEKGKPLDFRQVSYEAVLTE